MLDVEVHKKIQLELKKSSGRGSIRVSCNARQF